MTLEPKIALRLQFLARVVRNPTMSLAYLPEYAEQAMQALDLAKKGAAHIGYTQRTLDTRRGIEGSVYA